MVLGRHVYVYLTFCLMAVANKILEFGLWNLVWGYNINILVIFMINICMWNYTKLVTVRNSKLMSDKLNVVGIGVWKLLQKYCNISRYFLLDSPEAPKDLKESNSCDFFLELLVYFMTWCRGKLLPIIIFPTITLSFFCFRNVWIIWKVWKTCLLSRCGEGQPLKFGKKGVVL
jgi:hypothetical protein